MENAEGFTIESFFSSIRSLRRTNLTSQLSKIQMPAMGIYGGRDVIVSPREVKYFRGPIAGAKDVWIPNAGHFVMWDTPKEFNKAFVDFMDM